MSATSDTSFAAEIEGRPEASRPPAVVGRKTVAWSSEGSSSPFFSGTARTSPLGWATIKGSGPPSWPLERPLDQVPGKSGWHAGNLVGVWPEESDHFLGGIASKPDQIRRFPAPDEKAVGWVGCIGYASQIDRDRGKLKRRRRRRECLDDLRMKPRKPNGRRETVLDSLPVDTSQSCWRKVGKPSKYSERIRARRLKFLNMCSRGIFRRPFLLLLRENDGDLRLREARSIHPAKALNHRIERGEVHDGVVGIKIDPDLTSRSHYHEDGGDAFLSVPARKEVLPYRSGRQLGAFLAAERARQQGV